MTSEMKVDLTVSEVMERINGLESTVEYYNLRLRDLRETGLINSNSTTYSRIIDKRHDCEAAILRLWGLIR